MLNYRHVCTKMVELAVTHGFFFFISPILFYFNYFIMKYVVRMMINVFAAEEIFCYVGLIKIVDI